MSWSEKADERRRLRAAPERGSAATASRPVAKKPGQRTRVSPLFIAIAAGAVIIPICQKLGWIDKLLDKWPFAQLNRAGGGAKGGISRFRFPGTKGGAAVSSSSPAQLQKGKQPAAVASSSLPRNKTSNNKKNKARRAEKRDERDKKRDDVATGASSGAAGGPGTLRETTDDKGNRVIHLNNVPKDEDILGGADGKTFTTHSKFKTSEMYARIREDRGSA